MTICCLRKHADDEDDVDIPDVILSARRYYRLRYFGLSTFLMLLVYSVPETELNATTTGSVHGVLLACLVFVVYVIASVSFYLVQGSDPGYLFVEEGTMDDEENPKHDREQQSLLHPNECIETTSITTNTSTNSHQVPLLLQHHSEYRPGGPSCALEIETITSTIPAPRHRLRHTHTNKTSSNENHHQHHSLPGNGEAETNHHTLYCQWSVSVMLLTS